MLGNNIAEIRKRKGMTMTELAEKAGIAKSYLSSIERNVHQNPSINVIEKIAKVLEVDVRILLKTDNIKKSYHQLDEEWMDLIYELRDTGVTKEQMDEYRTLLKFIKWKKDQKM
ncbi:XRE family transcriptional regulator, master regulator for biofilm formation [Cytobacillus horneckiae]|uniref:XRE family transcriptional regulator n=1 Tax=Cytobacillus horneckiae TaxID=549687 RepID=A0A2N0ZE44_9BACI|nr:XRE family transcriptional regulator [Cytobacillus horneckiae]MBN6888996.1 helix-turn-helix domain-containing protein [Cytobacillus horneckiae]MCM3180816.1 helix-turn-helix domain-containing protein [Cytobacillus horneckiae]MEC1157478.1 helix-turn-helix domain-containing protein [Cytobacillus horneckiae]MED2939426.1 helix-turn-helix domain-containing protein [Cytobacillus horneckiae]PKG27765.1 XRE family transcriptional regulator [Cytobacillus horneckiae]